MATYAIGDLQGCYDPLRRLLEYLKFDPEGDQLWFVGDLVNRGPQSLEVLRFVKSLGHAAIAVLGNHDLHLIMVSEGYGKPSKEDTLDPILTAPDRDELLSWLRGLPLFHLKGRFGMVHAGLLPQWDVMQALALSEEVRTALTAKTYKKFLANMWGSEPARWDFSLVGWDRLRVIVNAMTRMRFVTPEGYMEFRAPGAKAPPGRGPTGCVPWFDTPERKSTTHTIVCGHWSALGFRQTGNLLALDSGCLWGGSLTAVRLEDGRIYQMPCTESASPTGWE